MNKPASSPAPAIETIGLTKRFGDRLALDDVNLTVPAGAAFGFLGHNGAGKTTLIRSLLGLTTASAGEMHILGHPVPAERRSALAGVGAIVEEPVFYPHLSGRENLRVSAALRRGEAARRIPGALERVGLSARADEKVKTYSMGMRQRLGIARCLLCDPRLLILDELTNGLDPGGMLDFRTLVRELVEDEGRTVFLSSHLLDEVEKICDAAAIIDRGRLIAAGTIAHATRTRRTGTPARMTLPRARTAPRHTDASRPAPDMLLPPRARGRRRKTERPQRSPQRDHPITHHVAGPGANPRAADRSEAGRPRAHDPLSQQPRARTPARAAVQPCQPGTLRSTRNPCTSKEQ